MKIIIALCVVLLLASCANYHPREWTEKEVAKEWTYQVLNVADFALTADLIDDPDLEEANPIIGSDPSDKELAAWAVVFGGGHYLMTDYLVNYDSPESVSFWQNITIGIKAGVVGWNLHYKF